MNKMETRIRELESEIDAEARRMADGQKNLRKSERRIKEMTYASDEDRKVLDDAMKVNREKREEDEKTAREQLFPSKVP